MVRRWRPDIIHAHDGLVSQCATTLAQVTGRPIVATVHATEAGRHQGRLPAPLNRAVHAVERWLVRQAAHVITCSSFMRDEVARTWAAVAKRTAALYAGYEDARVRITRAGTPTATP